MNRLAGLLQRPTEKQATNRLAGLITQVKQPVVDPNVMPTKPGGVRIELRPDYYSPPMSVPIDPSEPAGFARKGYEPPGFAAKTVESYKRGKRAVGIDFLWNDVLEGKITEEKARELTAQHEKMLKENPVEADNWASRLWYNTVEMVPGMVGGYVHGAKYGAGMAGAAAVGGQLGPQALAPEEVVTVPVAYGAGQVAGSLMYWAKQGRGSVYKQSRDLGVSPKTAALVASIGGPIYGAIEHSQVDKIIPGLSRFKGALPKLIIRLLANVGKESFIEEGGQKVVTDSSVTIGKLIDKKIDLADLPAETKQIVKNAWQEGYQALGPMTLLQLPGAAVAATQRVGPTIEKAKIQKPIIQGDVQPLIDEIRREAAATRRQREEVKRQKEEKFETEVSGMEAELSEIQRGAIAEKPAPPLARSRSADTMPESVAPEAGIEGKAVEPAEIATIIQDEAQSHVSDKANLNVVRSLVPAEQIKTLDLKPEEWSAKWQEATNRFLAKHPNLTKEQQVDVVQSAFLGIDETEFEGGGKLAHELHDKYLLPASEEYIKSKAAATMPKAVAQPTEKQFKKWFSKSKVVNKKGEPLIVYHGTSREFADFRENIISNKGFIIPISRGSGDTGAFGKGFYFTPSVEEAESYAIKDAVDKWKPDEPYPEGVNIRPVYLSIKNPFVFQWANDEERLFSNETQKNLEKIKQTTGFDLSKEMDKPSQGRNSKLITDNFEKSGHDGILVLNSKGDIQEAIVFDAKQIKSAIIKPSKISKAAATEGKAVAPEAAGAEKAAEPTVITPEAGIEAPEEEPVREMSSAETKALTRQIEDTIRKHPVYQEYETALTETKSGNIKVGDLAGGKYYIPKQYKGELEQYAGTPFSKDFNAGLWNKFTFNPNEGSQWDIVAAERGMDIRDVGDFILAVKDDIENFRKQGTLVEAGLKGMREAAKTDPYCELLLEKWRMAHYGSDYNEINDYVDQWADDYGIPPEQAVDDYVGPNAALYKKIAAMPEGEEKERQIDYLADVEALLDQRKKAAKAASEVLKQNGIEVEIEQVEEIEPEGEEYIPFEKRGTSDEGRATITGAAFTRAKREIIQLAYGADSETGYHEGYHIIRKRLTAQDIKALDRQFKGDEEAEARAFAEFMTTDKAPTSFIRHAWNKLKALLTKIRAGLQDKGFRTVEDIFGEIKTGTVGLYGQRITEPMKGSQGEFLTKEDYRIAEPDIEGQTRLRFTTPRQAKFETKSEKLRRETINREETNAARARLKERLSKKPKVSRARLKIKLHDVTPPLSKDWTEKPKEPVTFLTEEPPPGKGKPPVTRVFDEKFYEQNRKKLRRSIWEMAGEAAERAALEFDRTFSAMSSRLGRIDQGLKYAVRRFVFDVNKRTVELMVDAAPMVKGLKKMSRQDRRDFKFAALNGDSDKINELVTKYKLQEQYQKFRQVLDDIFEAGNEVGLDILYRGDYWPRMVKDTKGLLKYLKTTEKWSLIQQALFKRQEAAGGRELTDDEKAMVVNTLLRGFRIGGISLSRPGFTKERSVEAIDRQIERFYYDINESLPIYIERMTNAITAREFFGKQTRELQNLKANRSRLATRLYKLTKRIGYNKPWPQEQYDIHISEARKQFEQVNDELQRRKEQTVEDSIGWYIKDLVLDGKVNPQQQLEIADMLKGIFEPRGMRGVIRIFTKLAYIDVLANPEVAMTQLEELGLSFYKSKIRSSKAVLQALTGTSRIKLKDIGVEKIEQYMKDIGDKWTDKLFFMLRGTDMAGKQTYVNTAVAKLRAEAKRKTLHADFVNKMRKIFSGEMNQTIDDLKNDRVSDNVKFLAFCELADVQPIAITEMPQYYARAGNLRIFYMLKSFMIRRFDFLRNEALSRMKKPIAQPKEFVKGLTKLIELVGILTMFGVGKDLLRHWFHGKLDEFDFSDSVIDNLLNFILLSKYRASQIGREGVGVAVGETLAPPFKSLDATIKDVKKGELNRTVRSIPIVGEPYYWWFGGGTETNKKRKRGLY